MRAIADRTFAPENALRALQLLAQSSPVARAEIEVASEDFVVHLAELLVASPPTSDSLRSHPDWLGWLRERTGKFLGGIGEPVDQTSNEQAWKIWIAESAPANLWECLCAFKRRAYLEIACLDIAGLIPFQEVVRRLSELADFVIGRAFEHCWKIQVSGAPRRFQFPPAASGFSIFAMGKLGGSELNYSSDVDLVFCRRPSEDDEENRFYTRLAKRLIQELSRLGPEGALYRVDMRLRPYGESGDLVPTLGSILNYYESWGEAWEKQALIKLRFIAGDEALGRRFADFANRVTFARQMDDQALEEIKRVKHRSEREYSHQGERFHVKQGPGGIRDIEFYVQYLQLIAGAGVPVARARATLDALEGLAQAKALLEGELTRLSLAYVFLRTIEHRLQLRSLTPQALLPGTPQEIESLARSLGFADCGFRAGERFVATLTAYRRSVRNTVERVYLAPGFLRPREREEEFARLLSERTPKERIRQLLSQFGFQDIDKAWQNLRLIGLGPAGRLLPPSERRAFLEVVYPLLEVLRDSIDPDQALHNLESFLTATGNRLSFLRTLASRRPHLVRLTNLLALSNLSHQILSRHPEYFDALARGIHLHEGRDWAGMLQEIQDRVGAAPTGQDRETVLRRFRHREAIRIAYRDLAGLSDPLEISEELSDLAEACARAAVLWTRLPSETIPDDYQERLHTIALGKFGSRQMHYSSDLDLVFLYDAPEHGSPEERAAVQQAQDVRIENILHLLGGITSGGIVYRIDLRLRPEGGSGLLARSFSSFVDYAREFMQPPERMAMVRSRIIALSPKDNDRWQSVLDQVVYGFRWNEEAIASIRHLKRRIELEKNKESRSRVDFKYGRGGIVDLEFLVQYLQIHFGPGCLAARAPKLVDAVTGLCSAGALSSAERDTILQAHHFMRHVENHYQMIEEWAARDVSRDSPVLIRLARSLGYAGGTPADARRRFLADWDDTAHTARALVDRYFYSDV